MLWTLLILICFFSAVGAAYGAATRLHAGLGGHILATLIGAIIGTVCGGAMQIVVGALEKRLKMRPPRTKEWAFGGAYFALIVLTIVAAVLAGAAATKAMAFVD